VCTLGPHPVVRHTLHRRRIFPAASQVNSEGDEGLRKTKKNQQQKKRVKLVMAVPPVAQM